MKVRFRILPSQKKIYFLDYGYVDGVRKRTYFGEDQEAAEKALDKAKGAVKRLGELGVAASPVEMAEYLTLKERVKASGATVHEALEFFLKHGAAPPQPLLLPKMVERWLDDCAERNLGKRTLESYRGTLRSLAQRWPTTMGHDLTGAQVGQWVAEQDWENGTKNKRLGYVRTCFAWAREKGRRHMQMDVLETMDDFAEKEAEEIVTLPLKRCEDLLLGALKRTDLMPYLVLGLFGGIRREEQTRLHWEVVDLEERTVLVAAKAAKGRKFQRKNRRIVDLTENAVAWLRAAMDRSPELRDRIKAKAKIVPANLAKKWPDFWRFCGLPFWPDNGLRKTFASMHYAHHQNAPLLQAQMGHGRDSEMIHQHYRGLKTKKEAAAFWALRPPVLMADPVPVLMVEG